MSAQLYGFILANREQIAERARRRSRERSGATSTGAQPEDGIALFLTHLAEELEPVPTAPLRLVGVAGVSIITHSAALRGRELLRNGFTFAQVVHGYGDLCQVVTDLGRELNAPVPAEDFPVFDRCVDQAIAGVVMAYGQEREGDAAQTGNERLAVLAREMRGLLKSAILSFDAMRGGMVGVVGSTGSEHARSLCSLRALVERSLTEVRLEAGLLVLERFSVREFMEEIERGAAAQAQGHRLQLKVICGDADVVIRADWEILALAVSNLLQNAFQFTPARGLVSLTALATAARVLIQVSDECGGLQPGKVDELASDFRQDSSRRPGFGLGLGVALHAVRVNSGGLGVRDLPGTGCVFTIELPRHSSDRPRARESSPEI